VLDRGDRPYEVLKRDRFCREPCRVSVINSGEVAGQTVFHCHLHLIAAAGASGPFAAAAGVPGWKGRAVRA
jgi:diadenosine tetraphosphate (Ap4A) HIT family hydrolase